MGQVAARAVTGRFIARKHARSNHLTFRVDKDQDTPQAGLRF